MSANINRDHVKGRRQMRHHLIPTPGMEPRCVEQQQAWLSAIAAPLEPAQLTLRQGKAMLARAILSHDVNASAQRRSPLRLLNHPDVQFPQLLQLCMCWRTH